MMRKNAIERDIDQEVMKVAMHLKIEVDKCPSNTHRFVLETNKKLGTNKVR